MRYWLTLLLLSMCAVVQADTLVLRGTVSTSPLVLRVANGEVWTCQVDDLVIQGGFGNLRQVSIDSMQGTASKCTLGAVVPPVGVGSTVFDKSSYAASGSIGRTYITVKRTGATSGALNVTWTASSIVSPRIGTLSWAAGDTSARFIQLAIPKVAGIAVVKLQLPGNEATLTITP